MLAGESLSFSSFIDASKHNTFSTEIDKLADDYCQQPIHPLIHLSPLKENSSPSIRHDEDEDERSSKRSMPRGSLVQLS